MSKYTTEIRFICESSIPLEKQGDYKTIDTALEYGRKYIFDFPYELFDDSYKPVIEKKFLRHYYTREIGHETVALFKLFLRDRMEMVLPYYNQLWKSTLIEIDPFKDVDYYVKDDGTKTTNKTDTLRETRKQDDTTTHKGTERNDYQNTRKEDMLSKYSDTPQGALDGIIDTDWLTNARQDDNTIVDNGYNLRTPDLIDKLDGRNVLTGDNVYAGKDVDDFLKHVYGKMNTKSYSELLMKYRETFLNVDKRFIDEFKKLFMLIY